MTWAGHRLLAATLLLAGAAACASAPSQDRVAPTGRRIQSQAGPITADEIRSRGEYSDLYELVQELRPRWLRKQGGGDSFDARNQGEVQVHVDGNRVGDITVLRSMAPLGVTSITWLGPIDAAARYGMDHSHGVIIISSRATL